MIYLIACISSFLTGLGIGGGALFMLLSLMILNNNLNEIRAYNLLLFVSTGIIIFFKKISKEKLLDKKYFHTIIFIIIGSVIGMLLSRIIDEDNIKKYYYYFTILIGSYEVISSLITIKNAKNNIKKGE